MNSGDLNREIILQAPNAGQDQLGQPVTTWTDFATVRAAINDASGRQFANAQAEQNAIYTTITIRYLPGVTASMRVVHGADVYDIEAVLGQDRIALTLMCVRGKDGASGSGGGSGNQGSVTTASIGALIAGAIAKPIPVDADSIGLSDSEESNILKKFTWANLKTALNGIFARLIGLAGGQTLIGGTGAGESLTLQSTSNATKGKILLGLASTYDDVNGWLGLGTTTPVAQITNFVTSANYTATVGPEILSSSGWTSTGWTGDFNSGFTHTTGNTSVLSYPSFTAGSTLEYFYRIKFTITGRTAGSVTITVGNVAKDLVTATGVLSFDTNSTWSLKPVTFTPTSDFNGTLSALQLSLVTKTQPLWATLDAAGKSDFEFRFNYFNSYNQAMGRNSFGFYTTTSGTQRICAYGKEALYHLVEGSYINAIGASVFYSLSKGDYNSSCGSYAGYSLRIGSCNLAEGSLSGRYLKYGSGNSFVGCLAGNLSTLTLANNMTYLGYGSGTNAAQGNDLRNSTALGANAYTTASNQVVLGDSNVTEVKTWGSVAIGGQTASAKLHAVATTEQLRLGYDAANYLSCTVSSGGIPTWTATGGAQVFAGDIRLDKTITSSGTTGAQTINKTSGSVNFAASATSLVVTNSLVSTTSRIIATVAANDATLKSVSAVAASGSFTLYANSAATAETRVNFLVLN